MYYAVTTVKATLEQVRLRKFPVILPQNLDELDIDRLGAPDFLVLCMNLEEVIARASKILEQVELWVSRQAPR
jgi:hypothetical protein